MMTFYWKNYPTASYIYKMLRFFKKTCSKQEMLFYVNQI